MPVLPQQVPLSTAKSWAKRLQLTSKTQTPQHAWPLSRCQLAVAQMLGFEHWHALSKALATPPTLPQSLSHQFPQLLDFPKTQGGWEQFWKTVCHYPGMVDIHICCRPNNTNIRLRVHGRLINYAQGSKEEAVRGLSLLLPPEQETDFLLDMAVTGESAKYKADPSSRTSYVSCSVNVSGREARFQFMPVYPQGWDAVIRVNIRDKRALYLTQLGLPEHVSSSLLHVAQNTAPGQVMVFSGTTGAGKTHLMHAVVNTLTKGRKSEHIYTIADPPELKIPGSTSIPLRRPDDQQPAGSNWKNATDVALRADAGILVIGEVRDEHTAWGLGKACDAGVRSFTTVHASIDGTLSRLESLDGSRHWKNHVSGWTYSRLVGILCPHCSVGSDQASQRRTGSGCPHCNHVGLVGRRPVIDIWWNSNSQEPVKLASMFQQARALINTGQVDRHQAEELMGPMSGWPND